MEEKFEDAAELKKEEDDLLSLMMKLKQKNPK